MIPSRAIVHVVAWGPGHRHPPAADLFLAQPTLLEQERSFAETC